MVRHIVAFDENGGIGKGGEIPWNFQEDMRWFKFNTIGSTCMVGRKTYESMGRLPKRDFLVVTNQRSGVRENVSFGGLDSFAPNIEDLKDVYICGGSSIYTQTIDKVDQIIVTRIPGSYECDVFYPVDQLEENFELSVEIDHGKLRFQKWLKK